MSASQHSTLGPCSPSQQLPLAEGVEGANGSASGLSASQDPPGGAASRQLAGTLLPQATTANELPALHHLKGLTVTTLHSASAPKQAVARSPPGTNGGGLGLQPPAAMHPHSPRHRGAPARAASATEARYPPSSLGLGGGGSSTPAGSDAQLLEGFSAGGSHRAGPGSTPLHGSHVGSSVGGQFWSPMVNLNEHVDDSGSGLFKGRLGGGLGSLQEDLQTSDAQKLGRWAST